MAWGDVIQEEDQAAYNRRRKKRTEKALDYIASPDFVPGLAQAVCSAMPRWSFARNINPKTSDHSKKAAGLRRSLSAILEDYRGVISRTDIASNFVLDRLVQPGLHRLQVFATIMRGLLYRAEKHLPFCNPLWGILSGNGAVSDMVRSLAMQS